MERSLRRLGDPCRYPTMAKIQFRISTTLLLTAIAALVIGWYADRPLRLELRIVGVWRHPFPGVGYWENLYFEPDGTFRREIHYRTGGHRFVGKYEVRSQNEVYFTFERRGSIDGEMRPLTADEKQNADCSVMCGFDSNGNLLLVNLNSNVAYHFKQDDLDECFIPSRNYERNEFTFEPAVTSDGG